MMSTERLGGVNAYGVSIRYKAADLTTTSPTLTTTSLRVGTSTTIPSGEGATVVFSTSSSTAASTGSRGTNTPSDSPSSLTAGAKAGIAVGAAVLALALIAILWFFVLKRRRAVANQDSSPSAKKRSKQATGQNRSELGTEPGHTGRSREEKVTRELE